MYIYIYIKIILKFQLILFLLKILLILFLLKKNFQSTKNYFMCNLLCFTYNIHIIYI